MVRFKTNELLRWKTFPNNFDWIGSNRGYFCFQQGQCGVQGKFEECTYSRIHNHRLLHSVMSSDKVWPFMDEITRSWPEAKVVVSMSYESEAYRNALTKFFCDITLIICSILCETPHSANLLRILFLNAIWNVDLKFTSKTKSACFCLQQLQRITPPNAVCNTPWKWNVLYEIHAVQPEYINNRLGNCLADVRWNDPEACNNKFSLRLLLMRTGQADCFFL